MKILEELKRRENESQEGSEIPRILHNLAVGVAGQAEQHLKRVVAVLSEFDIHDGEHSKKVLSNIEQLLGDESIRALSSYELFFMYLAAFLHDCAMAPPEWEIRLLELTEGSDSFSTISDSIRRDLKPPLEHHEAQKFIRTNKGKIFHLNHNEDNEEAKEWLFYPASDEKLIGFLSQRLIDYQNFRNGFADQFSFIKTQDDFNSLNRLIRSEFIRSSHHARIEDYIKNLETKFSGVLSMSGWGKKLATDLALICRSHGENIDYVEELSAAVQYVGNESVNLQFIAVMLRLGDIIHFDFGRAPVILRSAMLFKSEYSFKQWAIKGNGVNYSIDGGEISFRAYCDNPDIYFRLHEYLDWIDCEIQYYFKFLRSWKGTDYPHLKEKVNRAGIEYDKEKFQPQIGLRFSLDQKRIIELLMGVELYKSKYYCIRELYQNALDACRCMLSLFHSMKQERKGEIEFGLQNEEDNIFLYCSDNGIGMTKDIIERYLLNIGNSYYKSQEFFRKQSALGDRFTPISQFGIGILSCFMLGDRIEIITKSFESDCISCVIDGPHEYFYYKPVSEADKEKIKLSGTIIKILLNSETKMELCNGKIEKLGLLLLCRYNNQFDDFPQYDRYYQNWENHLYKKIDELIGICHDNIDIFVRLCDETRLEVYSKPIFLDQPKLDVSSEDFDFIDSRYYKSALPYDFAQRYNLISIQNINIEVDSVQFVAGIALPKNGLNSFKKINLRTIPSISSEKLCIDGVNVPSFTKADHLGSYTGRLLELGILNFKGSLRPQLSIDRTCLIDYPEDCENVAKEISQKLIQEIINLAKEHIRIYSIKDNTCEEDLIWESVHDLLSPFGNLYINEHIKSKEEGDIFIPELNKFTGRRMSILEFISQNEINVEHGSLKNLGDFISNIVLSKIVYARDVTIQNDSTKVISTQEFIPVQYSRRLFRDGKFLILPDKWENIEDTEYDIISKYDPFIPKHLFDKLNNQMDVKTINERTKKIHILSNGLSTLFEQDPLFIHEYGFFQQPHRVSFFNESEEDSETVRNYGEKVPSFWLHELNSPNDHKQKQVYVLYVFISPRKLTEKETRSIDNIRNTDTRYVEGVETGWSVLVTGQKIDNTIIRPGMMKRADMVSYLSEEFWKEYEEYAFKFLDGSIMERPHKLS